MNSIFCLVIFLSLSISVRATTPVNASESLVKSCNQTPSPDLCVKHLLQYNESQTADIHFLTGLMVRAAAEYAKEKSEQFFEEKNDMFSGPDYDSCLGDCSDTIEDAIEQLDDTTKAVDMRAFDDVKAWVSAAIADACTCKESCKGSNGEPKIKPLGDMTAEFIELCKVILAFAKLDAQRE